MSKADIKDSIVVNVPADKAWDIIGPNFLTIGKWGRGISRSWNNEKVPITIEGAPAGGRFCDLGSFGKADERILHYDMTKHEISWSASIDKMPGFLKNLRNDLKVEPIDDSSCRVSANITADLTGVGGFFMGGMMKKNFAKLLKGFLKDWKTYSETGDVSDTKKREIAKLVAA